MQVKLYENCKEQNVPSIFGFRRCDGTQTVMIQCINCCETVLSFFKCLDVWKSNGNRKEDNVITFEISKSMIPYIKSKDMLHMLQRWDVAIFDFDDV